MKKVCLVALICTFIDQVIKISLSNFLNIGESINIVDGFFAVTMLYNTGAAFSILNSNTILLIMIGLVALILIYVFWIKDKILSMRDNVIYGMLIGGILGNLTDRVIYGYVIDYLDFTIFGYAFPVFNFADILIVSSIFLIIVFMIKGEKNEVSC